MILTGPVVDVDRSRPAAVALLACQARDLAFCLLELAEHADRERRTRR